MAEPARIREPGGRLRRLPPETVNRIAAGEVVERPAAAVKELVENAIDAGAGRIDVTVTEGGRGLIAVADDGRGMSGEELALAIERHATSKLPDDDLVRVQHLGFRGEALPSLGAVGRLAIVSRPRGADSARRIAVEGGAVGQVTPAAGGFGTRVELRDLFYATPARLNFLKTERTEWEAAVEVVKRLALAHPAIAFSLSDGQRIAFRAEAAGPRERLIQVMGREFGDNSLPVEAEREGVRLSGFIGLPTLNRRTAADQLLFVNRRPVRDRLLLGAVKGAYRDVMAPDRQPVAALFIDLPPEAVDVNVHPAKAEVRFRDGALVRGLVVAAIRRALEGAGHRAASTGTVAALQSFRQPDAPHAAPGLYEEAARFQAPFAPQVRGEPAPVEPGAHPLGAAAAQVHGTYIVAATKDGLVIVDQHAAHERLVFERVRAQLAGTGVARQVLLIPEVVEMEPEAARRLVARAEELARLGLLIEPFGQGAVVVRETPALVGTLDAKGLLADLAEELAELDQAQALNEKLEAVCASMACHGSVRAGRVLSHAEMNALLREMEATPRAGQCGHGRPTYIELKLTDIERLFGRS
ncbi:MAG: DNA mismatch repair endonuclease MutL [Alphaproteobacteria bacterium]|nr:DNA mismatch repair endonuclease MutL [Alphaproteobacteria bacterium]